MELEIPDGEIVDTGDSVVLLDDPSRIFALMAAANVYNYTAQDLESEADWPDMQVSVGGKRYNYCSVRTFCIIGRTLVVTLPHLPHRSAHLLVSEGNVDEPWRISSKMLVLPSEHPAEWGGEDEGLTQLAARVLLFAGLVTLNGWYQEI